PDGKQGLVGCVNGAVVLWDVDTGKEVLALDDCVGIVLAVGFSPDGKTLAAAGADGLIRLWDADTGKSTRRWDAGVQNELNNPKSLRFDPSGKTIILTGMCPRGRSGATRSEEHTSELQSRGHLV